jgi:alkylhydroperoxidase family enzyme
MSDDTPRIPLLSVEQAVKAAEAIGVNAQVAELNVFRALLQQPKLAKAVNDMLFSQLFGGNLDARLRELIIMRLGWQTGSVYEWTQHWRVAKQLGVEEEDLLAVRDWRASDRFDDAARAVLAATDETLETGTISAGTWKELERSVGDPDEPAVILEVVSAIGTWRMISSVLRSLQIPLEDGVEAWPPDGKVSSG